MGLILGIKFSEATRRGFCYVSLVLSGFITILSLVLIITGGYIKVLLQIYTNLIENYDSNAMSYVIAGVGLLSFVIHLYVMFVCNACLDPDRRCKFRNFLFGAVIAALCLWVCLLSTSIYCFVHIKNLGNSFKGGLVTAMRNYNSKPEIKSLVDRLQMEFSCCGSEKYTDWFEIGWVSEEFLDMSSSIVKSKVKNGQYQTDDTPFSCCDPSVRRPCVHHQVHENAKHFNYDYQTGITVYTTGCTTALMNHFGDRVLLRIACLLLILFFFETVLVFVLRFLQTSISSALKKDDAEAAARGYLFAYGDSTGWDQPNVSPADLPSTHVYSHINMPSNLAPRPSMTLMSTAPTTPPPPTPPPPPPPPPRQSVHYYDNVSSNAGYLEPQRTYRTYRNGSSFPPPPSEYYKGYRSHQTESTNHKQPKHHRHHYRAREY